MQWPASVAMESVLAAIKGAGPVYGGIYATRTDFIREIYAGPAVPFMTSDSESSGRKAEWIRRVIMSEFTAAIIAISIFVCLALLYREPRSL
jgi:hypothetical protein